MKKHTHLHLRWLWISTFSADMNFCLYYSFGNILLLGNWPKKRILFTLYSPLKILFHFVFHGSKSKVIQLLNDIKVSQKLSFCSELFLFQKCSKISNSDQQKKSNYTFSKEISSIWSISEPKCCWDIIEANAHKTLLSLTNHV